MSFCFGMFCLELGGVGDVDDDEVPDGAVHILYSDRGLNGEVFGHFQCHLCSTVHPFGFGVVVELGSQVVRAVDFLGLVLFSKDNDTTSEGIL